MQEMRYEGDPIVLSMLKHNKQQLLAGTSISGLPKIAGLWLSGIMRGAGGAGHVRALEEEGYLEAFRILAGTSTGNPIKKYFRARQARLGATIYPEECTKQEFLSFWRLLTGGPVLSTRHLLRVFRGEIGNKKLDIAAIQASSTILRTGVTHAETGKGIFLDDRIILPDMLVGTEASISVPGLSEGVVYVNGEPYIDGAGGLPFGARELYEDTKPDAMLIFANCAGPKRDGLMAKVIASFLLRRLSPAAKAAFMSRHERFNEDYRNWMQNPLCPTGIVWTDNSIGSYTQDPTKLRDHTDRAHDFLKGLLANA